MQFKSGHKKVVSITRWSYGGVPLYFKKKPKLYYRELGGVTSSIYVTMEYLTIIPEARVGYEVVDSRHDEARRGYIYL